jgi:hypothetical protein
MGRVLYKELEGDLCGYFDPDSGALVVDPRLGREAQRNTIIHEGYHRLLGHGRAPSLAVHTAREVMVERLTARHLIPLPSLLNALVKCGTTSARARSVGVSENIWLARLVGLETEEQLFVDVCARRCIGVAWDV